MAHLGILWGDPGQDIGPVIRNSRANVGGVLVGGASVGGVNVGRVERVVIITERLGHFLFFSA